MKIAVRANALATLLDRMPEGIRILSLDCFDTLLWRNTHSPVDVFSDLSHPGGAAQPRIKAEAQERISRSFEHGCSEVTIEQIYRNLMPKADDAARAAGVQAELDAEARHCFGFEPTVALMRDAKARGLKVIVVSDTYLSADQLRTLIARAAGQEVVELIDRIFASSEYGTSKSRGLFKPVLKALNVAPDAVLHVGDNLGADQIAPSELGIATVHLEQFDGVIENRLRLEAGMAAMVDPAIRCTVPMLQPHRAALALRDAGSDAWVMGHDVLGPVLHGFATWLQAEAAEMTERTGKPVKMLFLMRDGYLPMQVYQALGGEGIEIEASRLTATRASFVNKDTVAHYVTRGLHRREDSVGRALMLSDEEIRKLTGRGDHLDFKRALLTPPMRARIVTRSKAHAERLIAHFRARGVEDGDAVMLVDLGYNGSVQNMIEPVLEASMGLTVTGRYLLLREQEASPYDKRGFLDNRHFDYRVLDAFSMAVAVVEQMCTLRRGSVIDYERDGTPIYAEEGLKSRQSAVRDEVQAGCLVFTVNADAGITRKPVSDDADARRRMAAATLARFLFLPSNPEIGMLKTFDHDVNLGVGDIRKLVDVDASITGLRQRGLQYLKNSERMYMPGELQPQGIAMNLSFFSINRFALDLRGGDFMTGPIRVPAILTDGKADAVTGYDAVPTHEGYYILTVPIGAGRFSAGIQFGTLFEMVQVEEVNAYDLATFPLGTASPIACGTLYDGASRVSDGIFRFEENGMLFVEAPKGRFEDPLLLVVVFRPIMSRTGEALRRAA
jgi:FMN phosphatase YigB (HAD superfamily)